MVVADEAGALAASLTGWLGGLTFRDRAPAQVTALLLTAVEEWATGQGWRVYRRAASVAPLPPPMAHRHSWLDLGCARPSGPPVAIEIDGTDRRRTVEKLLAEAAAGRIPIWVRWGSRGFPPPPAPVAMATLRVTVRPGPDGPRYSRLPDRPAPPHQATTVRVAGQGGLFADPG